MKTKIVHWQLLKMVRLLLICLYLTSKTKANKPMVTYYINVLQHIKQISIDTINSILKIKKVLPKKINQRIY